MPSSYLAFLISITALTLIQIFPGALAVLDRQVPLPGDVSLCRPEYGRFLKQQDCRDALRRMPLGDRFVSYTSSRELWARMKVLVPLTYESEQQQQQPQAHMLTGPLGLHYIGNCKITVNVASSPGGVYGIRDVPTSVRKLAEHVIAQCLWSDTGNGGFVTHSLKDSINTATSVSPNIGVFLIVTVSSRAVTANPGKTDPAVVERVMELNDLSRIASKQADVAERYKLINADLARKKAQMTPGGRYSWLASEVSLVIPPLWT